MYGTRIKRNPTYKIVEPATPPTARRKFANPLQQLAKRHAQLKKAIKPKKLVQMTLEGKKATKPPPKRKRAKKGKDKKPTKQTKLVKFTTKDGKKVSFKPKKK